MILQNRIDTKYYVLICIICKQNTRIDHTRHDTISRFIDNLCTDYSHALFKMKSLSAE